MVVAVQVGSVLDVKHWENFREATLNKKNNLYKFIDSFTYEYQGYVRYYKSVLYLKLILIKSLISQCTCVVNEILGCEARLLNT